MKEKREKKFKLSLSKTIRNISVLAVLFILFNLFFNNSYSYKEYTYRTIYVSKGDTLWEIARNEQKNNEFYKNMTMNEIIDHIFQINNLSNSELYINQELKIAEL